MATQKTNKNKKVTTKKAVKKVAKKATKKVAAKKATITKKPTKKVAAKKASTKKTASKASTKKTSSKKTAVKKTPVKKTVAKKVTKAVIKKSATKKIVKAKPVATKAKKKASSKATISKSVQLNSDQGEKSDNTRNAPIVFSLEDVEALVANRKEDASEAKTKVAKKKASSKATKAVKVKPAKVQKHAAASIADILGFNPNQKKSSENVSEKDIPAKWKKYYKLLLELRDHVKEELALHTSETLKQSSKENSGDLSGYGSHQADAGTETFDRDFALGILSNEQDALNEIEEAIYRIKNGTYGICEETGKPINKQRLTVVPFTRFSLEGQVAFEKNNRKRRNKLVTGLFEDNSDSLNLGLDSDDE
jgi:RNA polymerase-binding transcription factor DksA